MPRNDRLLDFEEAVVAMAILVFLAAVPSRVEAQCTLTATPKSFEPNPPGAQRPIWLSSGFNNGLELYQYGGSNRLLMMESFGYSILDLSNPVNPTALYYHDVRNPVSGANSIPQHGDGQNMIQTIAVSPDGQRVAFSTTGPAAPFQTVVGNRDGANAFTLWGDFPPDRANGTLVQHIGSRYIAYSINGTPATAADITTLPTGSLQVNNLAGKTETTAWSEGAQATLAGNYILYMGLTGLQVIDASNPGPVGRITANYPRATITSADFGGRTIVYYSAAVDPADATKLWVLVELNPQAGEKSPSYGLLYVTSTLAKVSAGPIWRVPLQTGELWQPTPGVSSALIASGNDLFVLMWAYRDKTNGIPSHLFRLYSTTVAAWASVNSAAPPGAFDIPTSLYGNFSVGQPMRGFSIGHSVYAYLPTGTSAYVIPMFCVSVNAPAFSFMAVAQAGAPLASGDTVFVGDQVTITPTINPPPASQPLTGFGWNFDFDFHTGAPYDDGGVGTSPRIRAPDNAALGSPPAPPALITVVGPCDPQVGGTSPGSGSGCWNSVTTNGAFGGADFGPAPAPGSTKALTFALEANNALGSGGAGLFTLNWKVPAARLQSTQVLSGQPLASGSDGHPTAAGYKWYFGPSPAALAWAGCTGPTCVPTLDTRGTYYFWLTASYANGYVTPDYAGTAAMGTYTVTDIAPAFTVNGSASGPITVIAGQNLNVANSSQRGAGISATYQYSLCLTPCGDSYQAWSAMVDPPPSGTPPTSATIPIPATPGTYALKIKVSYTGGVVYWPDPSGSAYFPLTAVSPVVVSASVNPTSTTVGQNVTVSSSPTGAVAPNSYE
ncbi:MAG: hypothetical protein ACHQM4_09210, partial [Thermoanaerobaculia bacterium]